jgi:hypothetical protein
MKWSARDFVLVEMERVAGHSGCRDNKKTPQGLPAVFCYYEDEDRRNQKNVRKATK